MRAPVDSEMQCSICAMRRKKIFVLVGHPDANSLSAELATRYADGAKEAGHEIRRTNLGELSFDPILHKGYKEKQELEPDLVKLQGDIKWADIPSVGRPSALTTVTGNCN